MKKGLVRASISFCIFLMGITACNPTKSTATPKENTPHPTSDTSTQVESVSTDLANSPAEPADTIFYNGNIITIDKKQPVVEAIAIKNGLIKAVGTNTDILTLQGAKTVTVDLQGQTLLPGFQDGHTHYVRNSWEDGVPIQEVMDTLLSLGLVSITEMNGRDETVEYLLEAEQNGEIRTRVNMFPEYNWGVLDNGHTVIDPAWYLEHDPILDPTRMVRIPGVKIYTDGAGVPSRGCPYTTFPFPDNISALWPGVWEVCGSPYGDLYLTEEQLTEAIQSIQERGYRAAFHAMGDAAIDTILNSLETVLAGESNTIYRHQIQHSSYLRPDQVERYLEMDILTSLRGTWNTCDAEEYIAFMGEDYYEWSVNRYSLPELGAFVYLEGDFGRGDVHDFTSFRPLNPIHSLWGYVTHQQIRSDGSICYPPEWVARHEISVEKALEMMTILPAYAVSMEDTLGSLEPGKSADLVILSDDPLSVDPDSLKDILVWMTMIKGEVQYCLPGHETCCQAGPNAGGSEEPILLSADGAARNLALDATVEASDQLPDSPAEYAVDGDPDSIWNSGSDPQQWIEVDLVSGHTISEVRLLVAQYPGGETEHQIWFKKAGEKFEVAHTFRGHTEGQQWLVYSLPKPIENVQAIRVETLSSPSWVAWAEVEILGE